MEILRSILLFLHLLGMAALFGGLLAQLRNEEKVVLGPMRDGIGTAFLAGLGLVGVLEAGDDPVNHAKVGVKLVVGLILLVLVMMNLRKKLTDGVFFTLIGLTVLNVGVAVLWR